MSATHGAVGLGARVTLIDRQADKLAHAEALFGARVETRFSSPDAIADSLVHRPTSSSAPRRFPAATRRA
jgi:alanine dehydrogenase